MKKIYLFRLESNLVSGDIYYSASKSIAVAAIKRDSVSHSVRSKKIFACTIDNYLDLCRTKRFPAPHEIVEVEFKVKRYKIA